MLWLQWLALQLLNSSWRPLWECLLLRGDACSLNGLSNLLLPECNNAGSGDGRGHSSDLIIAIWFHGCCCIRVGLCTSLLRDRHRALQSQRLPELEQSADST